MRRLTQRGFIDYAARRAVGLLCVGAAVASVLGPALGREQCANQPPIRSPLFGPGLHLGDYRLDLVHPNLSDRKAIQDHFKYSVIFGELLREALSKTTAGECGVAFGHTHFPDLHVALTKSAQSTDGSNGRDYCQAAILSLARSMQPSDAEIHASGIRRLEATIDPPSGRRQGVRRRALLDDEVVLDGWLADGLPGGQCGCRAGLGQAQELPRLRDIPAGPDRRHRHPQRGNRLPARGQRDLRVAPQRAGIIAENFQFNNIFDTSAAKADLHFASTILWEAGVQRMVAWLDEHGRVENSDADTFEDRLIAAWGQLGEQLAATFAAPA